MQYGVQDAAQQVLKVGDIVSNIWCSKRYSKRAHSTQHSATLSTHQVQYGVQDAAQQVLKVGDALTAGTRPWTGPRPQGFEVPSCIRLFGQWAAVHIVPAGFGLGIALTLRISIRDALQDAHSFAFFIEWDRSQGTQENTPHR